MVKTILKVVIGIILSLAGIIGVYLLYMQLTDYKPDTVVNIKIENNRNEILKKDTEISILTFNIGYCGLDKNQDFFMDGGTGSRSESKEKTIENLKGISSFIKENKTSFILLQEVDLDSTRSYGVNEYDYLKNILSEYGSVFAYNYKVPWVPVPIQRPHGKVNSGLVIFSKDNIQTANRYQYPGNEAWPIQLAELDRCFIETRLKVEGGKDFILLNSHLSAFDKGGSIRKQQLGFLKSYIKKEYEKGNYVVVGGDWNHAIAGDNPESFKSEESWPQWLQKIPDDFKPEGFTWVVDPAVPSVRTDARPYKEGINYLSVIDGFLVSSNIEVKKVNGYNLKFEHSDHNPVKMEITFK